MRPAGLYYFYVLMAMILLLNLLIALMGSTFTKVTEESTLRYRQDFARRVLRLELLARRMNVRTNVGKLDPRARRWEKAASQAIGIAGDVGVELSCGSGLLGPNCC